MDEIIVYSGVIGVLTLAIVELVKASTNIPQKLMPLISVIIGVVIGAIALFIPEITGELSVGGHLLAGLISGLSASGLYDVFSKTTQGVKDSGSNIK